MQRSNSAVSAAARSARTGFGDRHDLALPGLGQGQHVAICGGHCQMHMRIRREMRRRQSSGAETAPVGSPVPGDGSAWGRNA